ncbi:hypothetical protein N9R81_05975, partial [Flavobacteriales bacterium]|nr:hypothetical protein [Flavobacteriales bacterium]
VRYFYVLQAGVIAILLINIVAFVLYKNWKNVHDKSLVLLLGALVFVGVFAFTNPCGFYHLNFLKLFLRHADGINNGVAFNDGSSFVAWLGIITKNISAAPLLIGLLAVPVRLYVKKNNTTRVIMYSWLLVYSCFLLFGVKLRFAHYALPLAPFIFIAFGELIEAIADRLSKGKMVFITAIMIGITAYFGLQLLAFKQTRIAARQNAVQLEVAKWLEENTQASAAYLSDHYTYIPAPLQYTKLWGITTAKAKGINHDYLLIHKKPYSVYLHPEKASTFKYGESAYLESYSFYTLLEDNNHPDYNLIKDFGAIKLFRRH